MYLINALPSYLYSRRTVVQDTMCPHEVSLQLYVSVFMTLSISGYHLRHFLEGIFIKKFTSLARH
jgi:hypothetical protein